MPLLLPEDFDGVPLVRERQRVQLLPKRIVGARQQSGYGIADVVQPPLEFQTVVTRKLQNLRNRVDEKYPAIARSWRRNWDLVIPFPPSCYTWF